LSEDDSFVAFGHFRLNMTRRVLLRDGLPVTLGPRAADILVLLVRHRDRVMSKDELLTQVWRGNAVEENNLAVQVSALRRALGEAELDAPLILTVPGHGYRFVGRIEAPPATLETPETKAVTAGATDVEMQVDAPPLTGRPPSGWRWRLRIGAAAAFVALCGYLYFVTHSGGAAPRLSIAVLPFEDKSDDHCCAALADAVTDDLTTDLSHIPGSIVIARESAEAAFRDSKGDPRQIGRSLNVRYLLGGSLRAVDDKFFINAWLIEAATGREWWSQHRLVSRHDLGLAQDMMVHGITSAIGVELIKIEGSAAVREHRTNPDTLDFFIEARSILDRSDTLDAMHEAQDRLEQALARQPNSADALGELALLLARKVNDVSISHSAADVAEARRRATDAFRVAPNSAPAIAARGLLLLFDRQFAEARTDLEAALAADPESVPVRRALISCLSRLGDYETELRSIDELLLIDPAGPATKALQIQRGIAYFMLDKPADALTWITLGMANTPENGNDPLNHNEYGELFRIAALQLVHQDDAAKAAMQDYRRIYPNRTAWQIGTHFTKAQAARPAAARLVEALVAAGMPRYMNEKTDGGVPPTAQVTDHGPFDMTPVTIPNAVTIDTAALRKLLAASPPPRLIDVGSGAAMPDPSLGRCPELDWEPPAKARICADKLNAESATGAVVVMGRNITDWNGYYAALALTDAGVPTVLWYRGGEEAWVAAGGAYQDMRQ
jgi:DNA-binding winged helix-turn-helix (wHTH) protein/TolB-like protein